MEEFKMNKEYMTMTQFLKALDYISSGGQAKYYLDEYIVFLNNERCLLRGKKLYPKDVVTIGKKSYILTYDQKNNT